VKVCTSNSVLTAVIGGAISTCPELGIKGFTMAGVSPIPALFGGITLFDLSCF